ncbi:MAG: hypothetical protein ACTHKS_08005 [Gaiellaceae bacterium]
MRAAVAAAATGVAAYGVRRLRTRGQDDEPEDGEEEAAGDDDGSNEDDSSSKREELTQALTSKVSDAKKAASKLKPGSGDRRSTLDTAWDAASDHVLPVAGDAASSLGASVAKKAPEFVREELMPRFIEGFQREAG